MNLFNLCKTQYKIKKPIRLIELFAGYGSQNLALKYLGANYESYKICEWNYKSFHAYKCLHHTNDSTDYSKDLTKEELVDCLYKLGISSNWNKTMTLSQIKYLKEEKLREIYNDIKITNNLVDITKVKGNDLEINDPSYEYIMTYSFPCQDLSTAGDQKGMKKNSNTRSGLLWEVERILKECKNKPNVLIMENVVQITNKNNIKDFNEWNLQLEKLGYTNYYKNLIATDYGIPQIRNRTFMISILNSYDNFYKFPEPIDKQTHFLELMESNVDDKWYIKPQKDGTYTQKVISYAIDKPNNVICDCRHKSFFSKYSPTLMCTVLSNQILMFNQEKEGTNLKIRFLLPIECFRLMGVKDEDFYKIENEFKPIDLRHMAGDSIVVNVLYYIFKQML